MITVNYTPQEASMLEQLLRENIESYQEDLRNFRSCIRSAEMAAGAKILLEKLEQARKEEL